MSTKVSLFLMQLAIANATPTPEKIFGLTVDQWIPIVIVANISGVGLLFLISYLIQHKRKSE